MPSKNGTFAIFFLPSRSCDEKAIYSQTCSENTLWKQLVQPLSDTDHPQHVFAGLIEIQALTGA